MMINQLAASSGFQLFMDEVLRKHACRSVEKFLDDYKAVDKSQIYTILAVIQAKGLFELRNLIEKQKQKKNKNEKFWEFMFDLVLNPHKKEHSFRSVIKEELNRRRVFQNEDDLDDKLLKKQAVKANKALLNNVIDQVLLIYFEHLTCHYFYQVSLNQE